MEQKIVLTQLSPFRVPPTVTLSTSFLSGETEEKTEEKTEGRTEVTRRHERRRKQLLDNLKEKREYCKLKEEALDRTVWRTRFGRRYGPVVRQTAE
jgi:hypothetical protein